LSIFEDKASVISEGNGGLCEVVISILSKCYHRINGFGDYVTQATIISRFFLPKMEKRLRNKSIFEINFSERERMK